MADARQDAGSAATPVLLFYSEVLNSLQTVSQATVDQYLDPNFLDEHNAFVFPRPNAGLKMLDGYLPLFEAFPDMRFEVETVIADQDLVMAYVTFTGTHEGEFFGISGSGNRVEIEGIDLFRLRGDRLAQHWGFADVFTLFEQIQE